MDVAARIKYFREKKGITVNKLANLAGISQSHLREIELGQRNPTVETLSYFCDALDISLEEFFKEENGEIDPCLSTAAKKLTEGQQRKLAEFINSVKTENGKKGNKKRLPRQSRTAQILFIYSQSIL